MLAKLKAKMTVGDNRKITSNFLALSLLQGVNFLLPLITFPYLVRVLEIEKFGLIMFAQAFIVYFTMLADYGFNLSGIREISSHRNNPKKITAIFNSIMSARILLIVCGFLLMNLIVFSFEKFAKDWALYYLTYGMVVGTAMFPTWFFQGIEKMKYITVLTIIAKLIFTLSIFIFVHSPEDYLYVPLINALGYLSVGIIALYVIHRDFNIQFTFAKWKNIKIQLLRGWHIFISKISINLYTATNTFVLGIFTNDSTVGYYAIAEKVVRIVTSLFAPFYQAIYPHIVQLTKNDPLKSRQFLQTVFQYTLVISSVVWGILFFMAKPLFTLVFGDTATNSIFIFNILSPLIMILPVAFLLFNVALLSYKLDYYFSKIYMIGGAVNIILLTLFFMFMSSKPVGTALSLVCSELLITMIAFFILLKHHQNLQKASHS